MRHRGRSFLVSVVWSPLLVLSLIVGALLTADGVQAQPIRRYSIATASTAGAWYPIAGAFGTVVTRYVDGVEMTAETGAATVENIRNLARGNVEFAFLQSDVIYQAYHGVGSYEGMAWKDARALFPVTRSWSHWVTLEDYGITDFDPGQFRDKVIGVGAPASGTELASKGLLELFGSGYDQVREQLISVPDMVTGLRDGNVHVGHGLMPLPTGIYTDLATTHRMRLLSMPEWMRTEWVARNPGWAADTIPAGSYPGIDYDVHTVYFVGILTTTTRMDEETIYQIMRAIWDHEDEWRPVHVATREVTLNDPFAAVTYPIHPGAVRFYRERGIEVPEELLPPEMGR